MGSLQKPPFQAVQAKPFQAAPFIDMVYLVSTALKIILKDSFSFQIHVRPTLVEMAVLAQWRRLITHVVVRPDLPGCCVKQILKVLLV